MSYSYRPWTGTLAVLHYFRQFLRARPGLPWRVGGCHEVDGGMPEVDLSPTVHIMDSYCQNPQCFTVHGHIPVYTPSQYPPCTTTLGTPLPYPGILYQLCATANGQRLTVVRQNGN